MSPLALLLLSSSPARAGYGDSEQQRRTPVELQLMLWIDAARVAPDAFEARYDAGGCAYGEGSWWPEAPDEAGYLSQSADDDALELLGTLGDELNSQSCDFNPCLVATGNVAGWVTTTDLDPDSVVLEQVLCDSDSRRFLLATTDAAFGVAVEEADPALLTGNAAAPNRASTLWLYAITLSRETTHVDYEPLRVGTCDLHGTCSAVWDDGLGAEAGPRTLYVTNGDWRMNLDLAYGAAERGLYQKATTEVEQVTDCDQPYWFVWESAAGVRATFPATGALEPDGCDTVWAERTLPPGWFSCASGGDARSSAGILVSAGLLLLARRRSA